MNLFKPLISAILVPALSLCPLLGQEPQEKLEVKAVPVDALDLEVRTPKKGETVLQYFQFLEKTLWERKIKLRLKIGSDGLDQYAILMKQSASKLFIVPDDDPFAKKSTLRNQLHRMAEPVLGRVEVIGNEVTIRSMKEDSEDFHDK